MTTIYIVGVANFGGVTLSGTGNGAGLFCNQSVRQVMLYIIYLY